MNDNTLCKSQWRTLIAECFSPRYGGNASTWVEANAVASMNSIRRNTALAYKNIDFTTFEFKKFSRNDLDQWLIEMFEFVGREVPPVTERQLIILNATH